MRNATRPKGGLFGGSSAVLRACAVAVFLALTNATPAALAQDCNSNGIPDECDVDCAAPGCVPPGCGGSLDCNTNGIPDECDIADCPGDPACDDCNTDGIPDECQLEANDCNSNGIPDECEGPIIYVDADAAPGGDGVSWATAYTNLQDALAVATCDGGVNFTEIWVANGTYMPDGGFQPDGGSHTSGSGDRLATFQLLNGVGLFGGFAGADSVIFPGGETLRVQRDPVGNVATLSGDLTGDDVPVADPANLLTEPTRAENSFHVVTSSLADATAILDGFTISGGNANGAFPDNGGGGMFNENGSPIVTGCIFTANAAAVDGGGMLNFAGSSPVVIDCEFTGNAATNGGGMKNIDSSPTVTNCIFSGNSANYGGGMVNLNPSSPTVTDCTFAANTAANSGGGMRNNVSSSPIVTGCKFIGNSADFGGGMANVDLSSTMVTDCEFSWNTADSAGGGMRNNNSSPTVSDCMFADNQASNGAGMSNVGGSTPTVTDCLFTANIASSADNKGRGGGMNNETSSPVLTGCTFTANTSQVDGGGLRNAASSPMVTDCTFIGNESGGGAGMFNWSSSNPTVVGCTFDANMAAVNGGGMLNAIDSTPMVSDCTFTANTAGNSGGAMDNRNGSSPAVSNCTFSGNSADFSAGMGNNNSNPTVTNCTFDANTAGIRGGGMLNANNSSPTVTNSTFTANIANVGAGMHNSVSNPAVTGCTFSGNTSAFGAGMNNVANSSPTVTNCTFSGNAAANTGGGMNNFNNSTPTVTNCTFSSNTAGNNGGGMRSHQDSTATVTNCTFSGNTAVNNGGGIRNNDSGTSVIANSVFWGNTDTGGTNMGESAQISSDVTSTATVNFSDVQGLTGALGGVGNLGLDPLFVDPDGPDCVVGTLDDDLRLSPGSPAIDAADNMAVPADTLDLDDDGDTDERIPIDLDGNPRFVDDPATPDTGVPDPPDYVEVVDMGAYEFTPDCNGNDIPDECDLDCGPPAGLCELPGCGQSDDCNTNGIPDECEPDCNTNGVPDECDISGGTSNDIDTNGIPDECETVAAARAACPGVEVTVVNAVISSTTDLIDANSSKSFHIQDATGGIAVFGTSANVDSLLALAGEGDSITITAFTDSYNGLFEFNLNTGPFSLTNNGFIGLPNAIPVTVGDFQNFSPTAEGYESMLVTLSGVAFEESGTFRGVRNYTVTDGFQSATVRISTNELDLVSTPIPCGQIDITGIFSQFDPTNPPTGTPGKVYELLLRSLADIVFGDCNSNGTPDDCDVDCAAPGCVLPDCGGSLDCNTNGIPDECDIACTSLDCNTNGIPDECDIADGTLIDANTNGVPDSFEFRLYVDASATGADDGSSWTDAFVELQAALAAAAAIPCGYTEIWVAAGVYTPTSGTDRTATFQLLNDVALYGGFAGGETELSQRDIDTNETILSGDLTGDDAAVPCTQDSPDCDSNGLLCIDGFCIIKQNNSENSYHVTTGSGTYLTAILDGFTITAGNANGASPHDRGGGMFNKDSNPTVTDCTFSGNTAANSGGGMLNFAGSSAAITRCIFTANAAAVDGGGMLNFSGSSPTVTDCTFTANTAVYDGGGMRNNKSTPAVSGCTFTRNSADFGGGMLTNDGNLTVTNCTFDLNTAASSGGGMLNANTSSPAVTGCTFSGNLAASHNGGGMFNYNNSSPTVTNCTFTGNIAGNNGGGMRNRDSSATVTNCTFNANTAVNNGGGMRNDDSSTSVITNCIFWDNTDNGGTGESAQISLDGTSSATVNYSDIQGLTGTLGGLGNLGLDPLFVDPPNGDYRLSPGSPAIDAADNMAVPADTLDLDDDGDTDERIPIDLDGNPRFVDDPATPDTGVADPPDYVEVVDMGAYELTPDCNGNDIPDECDLDCGLPGGLCDLPGCGQAMDCNGNDIPDDCEDDCNFNGIPDDCDISDGTSPDCNANEVPDECDLDVGSSPDCNTNGTPDECDIADCTGDPACGDCNINDVPDQCDIANLTSDDCNTNGVPDECEPDCNSNGIADDCDIAGGTSLDCQPNGVPDKCEDDCNLNGIPDDCDIAAGTSEDCNANGLPDECEIEVNSPAPGGPFFCQMDCDPDCNDNGIPDECDIAGCPEDDPDCGDCNNNGVPDACDIADGTSDDFNTDGIPDECIEWDDEARNDEFWGTALNWEGNTVPGGDAADTEAVVINIDGTLAVLNVQASVDSVIVGPTSTLEISAGDLTIDSPNGIHNRGVFSIESGFALIADAAMSLRGTAPITMTGAALLTSTAEGKTITNQITVHGEGVIDADLVNQGLIVADVIGGTLQINGPYPKVNNGQMIASNGGTLLLNTDITGMGSYVVVCDAGARGGCVPPITHVADGVSVAGLLLDVRDNGVFELAGTASVTLTSNVTLNSGGVYRGVGTSGASLTTLGSVSIGTSGVGGGGAQMLLSQTMTLQTVSVTIVGCAGTARGGCVPPLFSIADQAGADVNGSLSIFGTSGLEVAAGTTFTLSGDLVNESVSPLIFDWAQGPLTMDGTTQTLEAAGQDLGADPAGYEDNFAVGTLGLAAGAQVQVVDAFDNQGDGQTNCEALYVDTLRLAAGSTLSTTGCPVYYHNLDNNGGTIVGLGTVVLNVASADWDGDGDVDLDDYNALFDCLAGPEVTPHPTLPTVPATLQKCLDRFDGDHDGDLDLTDAAHFQRLYTGA